MELLENERIDDLQINNLKIIQNKTQFCFGIDAVLLSDFAKRAKKKDKIVDLCTGNGVIAILLSAKTSSKDIIGVEIQKDVANLAEKSIKLNNLQDRIKILNKNLKDIKQDIKSASIDLITVNPPYKKINSGIINENDSKTIARHEISCTLEDIVIESSRLLNYGGSLCMVHKAERLVDIFTLFRKYNLEPKRMRMVYSRINEPATLVLVEGIKFGKPFLNFESPIIVYKDNEEYTEQIYEIYGKSK